MAEQVLMLALSPTMEQGVITNWLKKVGDKVKEGEVICEVETDKATMEYESQVAGTVLKITVPEGGQAGVGDCIAVVGEEGEDVSSFDMPVPPVKEEAAKPEKKPEELQEKTPVVVPKAEGIKSTPLARKMATEHELDLAVITGTGPGGRITVKDVEQAINPEKTPPVTSAQILSKTIEPLKDEEIEITQKRRVIAERLAGSKFSAPHYYLKVSANVDELLRTRKKLKQGSNKNISLNAFIMKIVAEAIKHHPEINSSWADEKIIRHSRIDIALAAAQEDGLITPMVRDCGNKGILAIDEELKVLIEKARTNALSQEEYTGSTFTISNLGSFGIEEFTAIINPPESAILAIGQAVKTPVVDIDGNITTASVMKLTLSCDHRIIDGAVSAAFLADLRQIIESPISAFY